MKQIGLLIGRLSYGLDRAMVGMVFLLVAAMVIVTTLQVVFRVFFNALTWSEELSRYLLVWGTFFGATLAYTGLIGGELGLDRGAISPDEIVWGGVNLRWVF